MPPSKPFWGSRFALTERLIDRRRRFAEPFRPAVGHIETILQPDAELTGNIDAGTVREAHAGRELRRFAAHEVDRPVPVEADAVAGAVRRSEAQTSDLPSLLRISSAVFCLYHKTDDNATTYTTTHGRLTRQ